MLDDRPLRGNPLQTGERPELADRVGRLITRSSQISAPMRKKKSVSCAVPCIDEWYRELGSRRAEGQTALSGIPREAISLLSELWSVAASARSTADTPLSEIEGLRSAEHAGLVAEARSLDTLVKELRRQRVTTEQSLADARALLRRHEAELEELRLELSAVQESLTHTALERDVIRERLALRATAGGRRVNSARRAAVRRPKASSASIRASVKGKRLRPTAVAKVERARKASRPKSRRGSRVKARRTPKKALRK